PSLRITLSLVIFDASLRRAGRSVGLRLEGDTVTVTEMREDPAPPIKPKGWRLLKAALQTRKAASMLAFSFSSGLPFALLIGTLT
ncbi:hypothetical protein C1X73_37375, partial [Pseudomonas sp. FW305-130]